ncbi:sugar O-acetyltransferase [Fructilactobacillus myrtifloralis]|uniref:Sugar O-acetyltransferase n=1 Tax=Fructilactobacillus myrtifloralis TaxID=2940301 RepID=A0ABY5BMN3_9LACO|nr:DapH/DapD/GlmU-related protein [Fructilactobacillus myrtifloralis]USS84490.1 sugar O-acetyltransferase [Fructilactobacillus myrtifloralis]
MEFPRYLKENTPAFNESLKIKNANEPLIQALNQKPHSLAEIRALLTQITGKEIPASTEISIPFETDFGKNITIGKECFINKNAMFDDLGGISIGDRCLIGPNATLVSVSHVHAVNERRSVNLDAVHIEADVWLGANVTVLPGVTIGEGAIIGANSLVNKDIPPRTIAVGSPARVIKQVEPDAD